MDRNQIAKGWSQLISAVASLRRAEGQVHLRPDNPNSTYPSGDNGFDESQITPYLPEKHKARSESSLHLSC